MSWYIERLSKMPSAEIVHRLHHKFREKLDEKKLCNITPTINSNFASSLFNDGPITKLSRDAIPQRISAYPKSIDVFGIEILFTSAIDWHKDPKTGREWPLDFWAKVNIRDGKKIGGPKFVWEANRLYFLNQLGLAYAKTGERQYADRIFNLLVDWMEKNPYGLGVNWTSCIELSVRLTNVVWCLSLLKGYEISAEQEKALGEFVHYHGRHLYRYQSKYSSNNNHAIAEAFGLFLIGVYFPSFPDAKKWLEFGKGVLEREGLRQVLPDGGSYEYSTTYLSFVFDFFLLFKVICDNHAISYDKRLNERLERSCEYIAHLLDEKGNIPNIGDQDSAVLVNFGLNNHENFASILNTGAILFNRRDFVSSNFPDFKTTALLGEKRIVDFKNDLLPQNALREKAFHKIYEQSGLAVISDTVEKINIHFVGNATPLGMPPLYAHGHLDALSFYLSVDGLEFFVDPGTYLYHSGGKWRRYFRSTAAHNTVRINQTDFTEMPGDFMYGKPYKITKHCLEEQDGVVIWQSEHDAYMRLPEKVKHCRSVSWQRVDGEFIVVDNIRTGGSCEGEWFYHLHPGCEVSCEENKVFITNGNVKLEMEIDKSLSLSLYKGSEEPLLGWFSKSFNHLQKTYTLVANGKVQSGDNRIVSKIKIVS
ncbi:alginate lyase family protein [Desulfosediminicola sp.]|uniref:alginate lyase family protein n=1 Tax=Desulfosediminicola sp. TaxID=2886825 RepID=UPI003AF303EF